MHLVLIIDETMQFLGEAALKEKGRERYTLVVHAVWYIECCNCDFGVNLIIIRKKY